jgi:hypothetical protein
VNRRLLELADCAQNALTTVQTRAVQTIFYSLKIFFFQEFIASNYEWISITFKMSTWSSAKVRVKMLSKDLPKIPAAVPLVASVTLEMEKKFHFSKLLYLSEIWCLLLESHPSSGVGRLRPAAAAA